jgi:hypothetical protein
VVLSFIQPTDPPLGSTERILRLTVESTRPPEMPDADQVLGRLAYVDGEQPTEVNLRNVVHCRRASKLPQLQDSEIVLELADAWQLPGDCSQDGQLHISDSICLLSFLFLGQGEPPCGGGDVGSGALDPGSLAVLDSNGDGLVDLSDAVHVLGFLFLGTEPPTLGTGCIRVSGCPSVCR